jgi:uncharacterized membrane protein YgdD (TMEM256/DUF423 family)
MAAIGLGAFGAHGLKNILSESYLNVFEVGVRYQFYHGAALILLAIVGQVGLCHKTSRAAWCFLVGIVLFSGSLYVLSLTGVKQWGMVTPIGGVTWLIGWSLTAYQIYFTNKP